LKGKFHFHLTTPALYNKTTMRISIAFQNTEKTWENSNKGRASIQTVPPPSVLQDHSSVKVKRHEWALSQLSLLFSICSRIFLSKLWEKFKNRCERLAEYLFLIAEYSYKDNKSTFTKMPKISRLVVLLKSRLFICVILYQHKHYLCQWTPQYCIDSKFWFWRKFIKETKYMRLTNIKSLWWYDTAYTIHPVFSILDDEIKPESINNAICRCVFVF